MKPWMGLHKDQAALLREIPQEQMKRSAAVWGRVLYFLNGGLGQVISVIYFHLFIFFIL